MKITIVGGGEIGRTLCNLLSDEGHKIILIEKDSSFAKDIAAHTNAMIIQGDGTEITSMEEAKVGDSDVLIAATNDDKTNLMVAEIGKSFEIQRIIARVNSVKNEELFTQLAGMDVIPVVGLTVSHIKNLLEHEDFRTIAVVGSGDVEIIEIKVKEKSKMIDKGISDVPKGVISLIYRRNKSVWPDEKAKFLKHDKVMMTIKVTDIPSTVKLFS